jgi:hypothetical protein
MSMHINTVHNIKYKHVKISTMDCKSQPDKATCWTCASIVKPIAGVPEDCCESAVLTHRSCEQFRRATVTTEHQDQPGCFTAFTTIVTFSRPRVGLAASRSRQTTVRRELVESKGMERRPVRLGTGTVSSSASFNIWRCVIAMSNRKRYSRTLRVPQQVWLLHTLVLLA